MSSESGLAGDLRISVGCQGIAGSYHFQGAAGDDKLLESILAQGPRGWRLLRMLEQRCSKCLKLKVGRIRASLSG